MSGEGTDTFELWPVKHHGKVRYSSWRYYHRYENSYGYYYSVKQYTYWDGILHSRTHYYGKNDRQIEYLEKRMKALCENHATYKECGVVEKYEEHPFASRYSDDCFVNARYAVKRS